ncbi:hypothetical protein NOR_03850 [Metarhizium rileyi]|uniref:Uncharacterized protein n=1 Tax=Metarhizium rileyi (strain RCEF 4871) TaxID=1649241 RepID=A0A167ELP1_METRR|nr:hypothetical protein NOR_03850 [Metarhizium rileyi RCEF 4871]
MKFSSLFFFALSGLVIAGEQEQPETEAIHAYTKDNHNLKYVDNVPMDKSPDMVDRCQSGEQQTSKRCADEILLWGHSMTALDSKFQ